MGDIVKFLSKIQNNGFVIDSQDKNSSKEMDTKPIEEGIDALEFSGKTMIPNAKKLRDMGQSFTSAIGQLTNFSRNSSTIVTSPTTPLSPRTEQMIQNIEVEGEKEEEFKSLLHKKLYERNQSLHRNIHTKVNENYTRIPQKLNDLSQGLSATESVFQEALMALQKANHHCSETYWNMDDSINIANNITFPN